MDAHYFSFENINVYAKARLLVKEVYEIQNTFPLNERYALGDQLRRAATSISANIAEGSGRNSTKEKIRFIEIAYGSLMETFCKLQTACDLNHITEQKFEKIRPTITDIAKMLSGLRSSLLSKPNDDNNSITNNL